jgi:hypothetical protein
MRIAGGSGHDTCNVHDCDFECTAFWERNLRWKTDSSADGPQKDTPALLPAGMMGDRADIIFADPGEIGAEGKVLRANLAQCILRIARHSGTAQRRAYSAARVMDRIRSFQPRPGMTGENDPRSHS